MARTAMEWCDQPLELGEGLRWVDGRLVLVDILAGRLYEHPGVRPGPLTLLTQVEVPLGAVAPIEGRAGEWIAAVGTGVAFLSADGSLRWLGRPEDTHDGQTRMNDGVCDPSGRFWAASKAHDDTSPLGSLYRVDRDGSVTRVIGDLVVANGPAFTPDGHTMFLADSGRGVVRRYEVDPATGDVGVGVITVEAQDGSPDGMIVDSAGRLWTAVWGASVVRCYEADGTLVDELAVPTPQPTSVCALDGRLVVTTAGIGLPERSPEAGRLYAFDVPGLVAQPAEPYRTKETFLTPSSLSRSTPGGSQRQPK